MLTFLSRRHGRDTTGGMGSQAASSSAKLGQHVGMRTPGGVLPRTRPRTQSVGDLTAGALTGVSSCGSLHTDAACSRSPAPTEAHEPGHQLWLTCAPSLPSDCRQFWPRQISKRIHHPVDCNCICSMEVRSLAWGGHLASKFVSPFPQP